jgi:hypothetical protein
MFYNRILLTNNIKINHISYTLQTTMSCPVCYFFLLVDSKTLTGTI